MKKLFLTLAATAVLAAGCGQEKVDTIDSGEMPVEVIVDVLTPTELQPNEAVTLEVKVTQGGEVVDNADSVEFEVWESGHKDEGTMLEGELTKDGVYVAEYTFDHDGVYYMYAHTTARGMHVMPKHEMVVGNPDMSQVLEDNSSNSMEHMEHGESTEQEGHAEHGEESEEEHNH
ncbi:FixH family protein [Lysinibacillus sp. KU-BSD001]|uniref:FixH family protein n=1 Tax=Lysinibacillus sp. KU-BSD001 TaxID=3141328 RepID=UPI0036E27229